MSSPTNTKSIEYLALEDLLFDPDNPRFPSTLRGENEEDVIEWMLKDATIVELMSSIGEKGYFPGEPLLVVPAKKAQKYLVIEGNRRLCANSMQSGSLSIASATLVMPGKSKVGFCGSLPRLES